MIIAQTEKRNRWSSTFRRLQHARNVRVIQRAYRLLRFSLPIAILSHQPQAEMWTPMSSGLTRSSFDSRNVKREKQNFLKNFTRRISAKSDKSNRNKRRMICKMVLLCWSPGLSNRSLNNHISDVDWTLHFTVAKLIVLTSPRHKWVKVDWRCGHESASPKFNLKNYSSTIPIIAQH